MSARPVFDPAELEGLAPKQRADFATAHAVSVALDRNAPPALFDHVRALGPAWALGVDVWLDVGYQYLVLCAYNRERVRGGAPLILTSNDLPATMRAACAHLNAVRCAWLIYMSPEAAAVANAEILADAEPGGNA